MTLDTTTLDVLLGRKHSLTADHNLQMVGKKNTVALWDGGSIKNWRSSCLGVLPKVIRQTEQLGDAEGPSQNLILSVLESDDHIMGTHV